MRLTPLCLFLGGSLALAAASRAVLAGDGGDATGGGGTGTISHGGSGGEGPGTIQPAGTPDNFGWGAAGRGGGESGVAGVLALLGMASIARGRRRTASGGAPTFP